MPADALELALWMVVWVLGIEPRSSARKVLLAAEPALLQPPPTFM